MGTICGPWQQYANPTNMLLCKSVPFSVMFELIDCSAGNGDDPLADLSEVLTTEDDILGMLSDELGKARDESGMFGRYFESQTTSDISSVLWKNKWNL